MILQILSRTELTNNLQGMSRKLLKEELLNLHGKLTTKAADTTEHPPRDPSLSTGEPEKMTIA